jgi:CBS domain-containing protein
MRELIRRFRRNLELHTVSEVMTRTVTNLNQRVNVSDLASSLKGNKHMSFPVLDDKGYCGTINRIDLIQLLQHRELFQLPGT